MEGAKVSIVSSAMGIYGLTCSSYSSFLSCFLLWSSDTWSCGHGEGCQAPLTENKQLVCGFGFVILCIGCTFKNLSHGDYWAFGFSGYSQEKKKGITVPFLLWWTRTYIGADVGDGGVDSQSLSALLNSGVFRKHEIYCPYRKSLSGLVWSVLYSAIGCQCFIRSIQKLSDCWEVWLISKPKRWRCKVLRKQGVCGQ